MLTTHYLSMHVIENFWLGLFVALWSGWSSALLCLTGLFSPFFFNFFNWLLNHCYFNYSGVHEASHSALTGTPYIWKLVGGLTLSIAVDKTRNFWNFTNFFSLLFFHSFDNSVDTWIFEWSQLSCMAKSTHCRTSFVNKVEKKNFKFFFIFFNNKTIFSLALSFYSVHDADPDIDGDGLFRFSPHQPYVNRL